jgi:hypothetical protein
VECRLKNSPSITIQDQDNSALQKLLDELSLKNAIPRVMRFPYRLALLLLLTALPAFQSRAQNIPNASFDSIYIGGIDRVYQWITSDAVYFINDTAQPFAPNSYFPPWSGLHHFLINTVLLNYLEPDSTHFIYSLCLYNRSQLKNSDGSPFNSFIFNGIEFYSDNLGQIAPARSGSPFPYRPSHIKGMYRYEDSLATQPDHANVSALLKRWNVQSQQHDTIALAKSGIQLSATSGWIPFEIPFIYNSPLFPDSIVVLIEASGLNQAPLSLCIDDINFTYSGQSVEEPISASSYRAVPNPALSSFTVSPSPPAGSHFVVSDLSGRRIATGEWNGEIDCSHWSAGIYSLQLLNAKSHWRLKVIHF